VASLQLLEDRHNANGWCCLQQRHHLGIKDADQWIRAAKAAWRGLPGRQAIILLDTISRGGAELGPGCRDRHRVCGSELHVQPHLVIVDVSTGHAGGSSPENHLHT
jgi:hypothetical protein